MKKIKFCCAILLILTSFRLDAGYLYISIYQLYGLNNNTAFLIGAIRNGEITDIEPLLLKTVDGGKTWKRILIKRDSGDEFSVIYFINEKRGFIGGYFAVETPGGPFIYSTDDCGKTWKEMPLKGGNFLNSYLDSIHFYSETEGEVRTLDVLNSVFDGDKNILNYAEVVEVYRLNKTSDCWIAQGVEISYTDKFLHEYKPAMSKKQLIYKDENWKFENDSVYKRRNKNEKFTRIFTIDRERPFWIDYN